MVKILIMKKQPTEETLTPEQFEKMRQTKEAFYEGQLPFLRKLAEYEKLHHDVGYYRLHRQINLIREAELTESGKSEKNK